MLECWWEGARHMASVPSLMGTHIIGAKGGGVGHVAPTLVTYVNMEPRAMKERAGHVAPSPCPT